MEIERALPPGQWAVDVASRRAVGPVAAYGPPAPVAAAQPQGDWRRYLSALARNKWLVLSVTFAGTALGVLGARFLGRDYAAKAILWVERPATTTVQAADQTLGEEVMVAVPGWIQLVTSNAVMDSVVRKLRLYLNPKTEEAAAALATFDVSEQVVPGPYRLTVDSDGKTFKLETEDGTVVQRGAAGDSIGADRGFLWAPQALPAGKIEFSVTGPYEASLDLARSLKVRMDEGSNFLVLTLRGENPARITATVNMVASRAVLVAAEMKRRRFAELSSILGEQYDQAHGSLDSAEIALRSFRIRTAGVLGARDFTPEPRSAPTSQVFELATARDQIHRDREAISAAVNTPGSTGARVDALSMIQSVQQSPELKASLDEITRKRAQLRELRTRYTDEAAPVQQLRAELDSLEGSAIPAMARQLTTDLGSREAAVAPRAAAAMSQLRRLPTLELDETRLVREVASAEQLSNTVRQRFEAARLALVSSLPDVRVLDAAVVPHRPSASLGPILIVLAFLTSLGLTCAGVIMHDSLDPKIRTPDQVIRQMRLTILGAIPRVAWRSLKANDEVAPAIEALRALRLRVLHALHGSEPLMVTITSPGVGEGKSFTSSNLALSFADAGYRTLLIDGDLRRGGLHTVLGMEQGPGLTDVLAARLEAEDAVRETGHPGLSFISCGARMQRAPELLLSPRLKDSMTRLRGNYDVIIVDSPPLAAGVDPVILGTLTRHVMLVLRSGTSDLAAVNAKLEVLDSLPLRIIGAVLNDVRDGGAFKNYTYDSSEYIKALGGAAATGREGPQILQGANS